MGLHSTGPASETKFEYGTGWPGFWQPLDKEAVAERGDRTWFMRRTEVLCALRSSKEQAEQARFSAKPRTIDMRESTR